MDKQILLERIENYKFQVPSQKERTERKRIKKRRDKRLNWVSVSSPEFKAFIKSIKTNFKLQRRDLAGTLCWGRVPAVKLQKHMDHGKYIIQPEFFKGAKEFLKLGKINNKIEGREVAIFDREVPDTVFEGERSRSLTDKKYFASELSLSKKQELLTPVKHSTLIRTDISAERIISENKNVQYHFSTQMEKVKASLLKNDSILSGIVAKGKAIMQKNGEQEQKLMCLENSSLHIQSQIETRSAEQVWTDLNLKEKIESAKGKSTGPKAPWRDFGIVYDTEEKQFLHKQKAIKVNRDS